MTAKDLFDLEAASQFLEQLHVSFGLATMMTNRHGVIVQVHGEFGDFKPDVVNKPGTKIRVKGRTVCHIYAKYEAVEEMQLEVVKTLFDAYIKTLEGYSEKSYISSEQALQEQVEAMGIDPSEFLDKNPFSISMELRMKSDYVCSDSLTWIVDELRLEKGVIDVIYQKELVESLNRNLNTITIILLAITVMLSIISISLINK